MARKVLNRRELRVEHEAAEEREESEGDGEESTTKKKKTRAAAGTKTPVKRKSRSKAAKEVRLKAFWGVFNQSMKRVALFEYSERKQADQKAADLSTSQKTPHFVQLEKVPITE